MKDGISRRILKAIALARYKVDLGCTRFILRLKGQPQYALCGSCNGCGGCCVTPMIQTWPWILYFRSIRWCLLTWHRRVNGFELMGENKKTGVIMFRCTHYDPETKQCDSYSSRPGMCRDYPRNHLYDPNPTFIQECGFRAEAKNAELIRDSFKDLDLTPEQRAELEKKFHAGSDEESDQ